MWRHEYEQANNESPVQWKDNNEADNTGWVPIKTSTGVQFVPGQLPPDLADVEEGDSASEETDPEAAAQKMLNDHDNISISDKCAFIANTEPWWPPTSQRDIDLIMQERANFIDDEGFFPPYSGRQVDAAKLGTTASKKVDGLIQSLSMAIARAVLRADTSDEDENVAIDVLPAGPRFVEAKATVFTPGDF